MISFNDLNLTTKQDLIPLELENPTTGEKITTQVKTYLPVSDKIDVIQIALQKSEESGIYNEILLDMYFHLNMLFCYTDLEFSEEDMADLMGLYDKLESNGFILRFINVLEKTGEYSVLIDYLKVMKEEKLKYKNTAAAVLSGIIQDLPRNAAAAKEIMDSFDPNKYQQVVDFATAANGGRNINTQTVPVNPAASQEAE